jgi:hypothetical protein
MEASCDVSAAALPDVPRPSERAGPELHVLIVRFILVFYLPQVIRQYF